MNAFNLPANPLLDGGPEFKPELPGRVGIVLSGGGTYLYAHIGLLEALWDAGLLRTGVEVVAGTSAGSVVGSFYAMGYHPHWLWKVINWHLWGLEPPADGNLWAAWEDQFGKQVHRDFSQLIQFDWTNIQQALTHDITRLKGLVHDSAILELLKRYQYGGEYYKQFETDSEKIVPAGQRKDLYVIATNMTNGRETTFHYRQHRMVQNEVIERLIAEGGGRDVNYAVYEDTAPGLETVPGAERMGANEAVRCSLSVPFAFEPYYKKTWLWERPDLEQNKWVWQDNTAYYCDGAVRDNYPITVAAKLGGCSRVLGMFLGNYSYKLQPLGPGTAMDLLMRSVDHLGLTIYEADQDDGDIQRRSVRTLVPEQLPANKAFLDITQVGKIRNYGYITGAYLVYRAHSYQREVNGQAPLEPGPFMQALLTGQLMDPPVDWDLIFSQEFKDALVADTQSGVAMAGRGRGHTTDSEPETGYLILGPQATEFSRQANEVFQNYVTWRYNSQLPENALPPPPAGAAQASPAAAVAQAVAPPGLPTGGDAGSGMQPGAATPAASGASIWVLLWRFLVGDWPGLVAAALAGNGPSSPVASYDEREKYIAEQINQRRDVTPSELEQHGGPGPIQQAQLDLISKLGPIGRVILWSVRMLAAVFVITALAAVIGLVLGVVQGNWLLALFAVLQLAALGLTWFLAGRDVGAAPAAIWEQLKRFISNRVQAS